MKIGVNGVNGANSLGMNYNSNCRQPAFQAVNQKYLKKAEEWYRRIGDIDSSWYESLCDDVILFKDVPKQDAIDTINVARKYVNEGSKKAYDTLLKNIKNA